MKGTMVASCVAVDCVRSLNPLPHGATEQGLPSHVKNWQLSVLEGRTTSKFLIEYSDVFLRVPEDLGRTDMVKHHIVTGDAHLIRQPPRRLPWEKRKEADKAVEAMQNQGLIEPSIRQPLGFTYCVGEKEERCMEVLHIHYR